MSTTSNSGSRRVRRRNSRVRRPAGRTRNESATATPNEPETGLARTVPSEPELELPIAKLSEPLPPLIDTPADLERAARALAASSEPLALDTERSGGYTYGNDTCLLQLRKKDVGTFLIDTLALPDLAHVAAAFAGTWILHAADQDLLGMQQLGVEPTSVFDTEIAARLTGHEKFSLGALAEDVLGTTLKKSHQNENWATRPLPKDWLQYAALDVELLPTLREVLAAKLEELGRTEYAEQEFQHLITHPLEPRQPTWRDTKGLGKVRSRRGLAVARELWEERDRIGESQDLAPGRVLPNAAIVAAATRPPKTKHELRQIKGFLKPSARDYLTRWQRAVDRALKLPEEALPARKVKSERGLVPPARAWKTADSEAWKRLQLVRDLTAEAAGTLEVDPDIVLEPRVQREVVWLPMRDAKYEMPVRMEQAGARPWQRELLSEQLGTLTASELAAFSD